MPHINTPIQLKNEILSRLSSPVNVVEVTDDQVYRCIDRAIKKFIDYHYDGANRQYAVCSLTQEDIDRGYMILEAPWTAVTAVKRATAEGSIPGWYEGAVFDAYWHQGQDIIEAMRGGGYGSQLLVHWEVWNQYVETFAMLMNPPPDYHYNTKSRQLKIFDRDLYVGMPVAIEGYIAAATYVSLSELAPNEMFENPPTTEIVPHQSYNDPREFKVVVENVAGDTPAGTYFPQEAYDDWWLQDYATALVKYQWGMNLWKYEGQQLPGGVTVQGQSLKDEAKEEIDKLEEELKLLEPPLEFYLA